LIKDSSADDSASEEETGGNRDVVGPWID
jgi:hypothetical protein